MGHFGAKINIFGNFSESFVLIFLKLYLMAVIKICLKFVIWNFKKWEIYGPKIAKIQNFKTSVD